MMPSQFLPPELYQTITASVPIVCVDVIPVRKTAGRWEIGVITRATGPEAGKAALLGGRIWHNETITEAIERHTQDSWDITSFRFFSGNDDARPFHVQQYLHQATAEQPAGFDPTKHAVALTYLIQIDQVPKPGAEARDFFWIRSASISDCGYNQQLVMQAAFSFLNRPVQSL